MKPKHVKRNEAKERQEKYNALTDTEKLKKCMTRPGECKREKAKLSKLVGK